jgi:serine/threonine protein kinase
MSLAAGTRLGPYEIVAPLGAGGMGDVYRATDTRLNRVVAIKVLPTRVASDPNYRERFDREARVVSSLSHSHICALFDVGHQDGIDFFVMEYLEGETLTARLARGALPLSESLRCAVEMLEALEHAHGQGILHCDLKPSNILLTKSGTKLLDFGIAQIERHKQTGAPADHDHSPKETASLAAEDAVFGTVQYMAPERIEGQPPSASTDLFSLGAVLYEMITGRKAFEGQDRGEILTAVLTSEPVATSQMQPHVPPVLDHVITRSLAKDPDHRWQSAHDLRLELEWIAERGLRTVSRSSSSVRPTAKRVVVWGVGTAVIALIVGLAARSFGPTAVLPPSIRFALYAPEETDFSTAASPMDLSPDGHWLAFVAVRPSGQSLLWLRALGSTEARSLDGTDGAISPFWSPDSQSVGFFAQGQLKKVGIFGGVPRTLCDAGAGQGGTWNREGLILFAPRGRPGGLFRVSAAGGTPTAVTHLDTTRQDLVHSWPRFLPDGRRFLYRIKTATDESTGIYLGSLDAQTPHTRLVDADSNPVLTPGYLLFGRDGTLFAQAFDARRARLEGEPVRVADQVVFNRNAGRLHIATSDTGVLVYRAVGPQQLMWVDRSGRALGAIGPVGMYRDPALSPSGDRVAVSRLDPRTGTDDIWVIESGRGTAARLTFDPASERFPVWSPNGDRIAFMSNRSGQSSLYQKVSDGSQTEERLSSIEDVVEGAGGLTQWSRDGRFLVFGRLRFGSAGQGMWVLPMTGERTPRPFLQKASSGQLSPDGRWMAYVSRESAFANDYAAAASGTGEVYVRPFPPSDGKWQISQGGGVEPRWRGDGKELFYLAPNRTLMSVTVRTTRGFAADLPRPLFETALRTQTAVVGLNQYDVTADGERFLLIQPVGPASSPMTVVVNWTSTLRP